jgi:hypothetical protein
MNSNMTSISKSILKSIVNFSVANLVFLSAVLTTAGCSPESPNLKGFESAEKIQTSEAANFSPKVDILFVVDDSISMDGEQANLAANIPLFVSEIEKSRILDYHIGVITSSFDGNNQYGCGPGKVRACGDGVLNGGDSGITFVQRSTPNLLTVLSENLLVGTRGSTTERFFSPVRAALTSPLINKENAGFYRDDASIVVIFITDTEDQSANFGPVDFNKFLVDLKQGDDKKVLVYGAYMPKGRPNVGTCSRDDAFNGRLEEAIRLSNGSSFDICSPSFGSDLGLVATDVAQKVSQILYLNRAPDPKSIRVNYGSQVIPNDLRKGWTYDPSRNALVFGDELELTAQPPGTTLEVNFNAARYEMK